MDKSHLLQRFFNRIFSKHSKEKFTEDKKWEKFSERQKEALALSNLKMGEKALLSGDLKGLRYFEIASLLAPKDPKIWFSQALAFFEYGSYEGQEKALQLANKNLKVATELHPDFFEAWFIWGSVLRELGAVHKDLNFFFDAKTKLLKALELSGKQSPDKLAELYWQIALLWSHIAEISGEAIDVQMSVQSFRQALSYLETTTTDFFNDFGNSYLQMGLLINDNRMYMCAVECFQKSIKQDPQDERSWGLLAQAYSQLYINSMDEKYFTSADECFQQAIKKKNNSIDLLLNWAQLLGESGKVNRDCKRLKSSIEKCVRAYHLDSKNPLVTGQWVESLSLLGEISSRLDLMIEAENKIIKDSDRFPDEPDIWYAYGLNLISLGNYFEDPDYFEMAIEKINFGLSIDKACAELWQLLAVAYSKLGKIFEDPDLFKQSSNFFSRACNFKPACPSLIIEYASSLIQMSELSFDRNAIEKSIILLEKIIKEQDAVLQHPEWLFAYAKAIYLLAEMGEEEKLYLRCIEILLHVLLIDPDFPNAHFQLALCFSHLGDLSLETEFFHRALNYFSLAEKQDPENDQVWLEWGLTLMSLAELTQCMETSRQLYLKAEEKMMQSGNLGNLQAHYHIACLYSMMKKTDKAIFFLEKAQTLDTLPPLEELMQDEWLENLRGTEPFLHFISCFDANKNTAEEF